MQITFNKISKPNQLFSQWEVLLDGQVTKFKIYGETLGFKSNIYSVVNTETRNSKMVGSLASAKARVVNFLTRGN